MRGLETLEGRRLFSFVATPGSAGSLDVAVNGGVTLTEVAAGTFVVSDPAGGQPDQAFTGVEILTVTGGNGADEIRLSTAADGSANVTAFIDAGGGDDRVFIADNFSGTRLNGALDVHGGNGSDYIEITRGNRTTVFGENGDDVVVVLDGSASVSGGYGDDTAYAADGTTVTVDGGRGANAFYDGTVPA
jgi:hypothetical protein